MSHALTRSIDENVVEKPTGKAVTSRTGRAFGTDMTNGSAGLSTRVVESVSSSTSSAPSTSHRVSGSTSGAIVDIDAADRRNPQAVTEYITQIMRHYREVEGRKGPGSLYMAHQTDINEKMRAILIDWLVEVHQRFKLMPETLYLTVNTIDRFLESKLVIRQKLQLVGVTAMLLASKYEELYAPEVRDFVYITDKAYTKDQILNMESTMLNALRFQLTVPTAYVFLPRFLKAAAADNKTAFYAHYLVERTLQEYKMLRYLPSTTAAAAVCLALKSVRGKEWTATLRHHTGYTAAELRSCMGDIRAAALSTTSLEAVKKKYASAKFGEVSSIKPASLE